jgi:glucose-1-phosphate thymidylyltransferase
MKGICLAGGKGTRLLPTTKSVSKQLHCVYNKPMIYYPLETLKSMGIKDILIITADPQQCRLFEDQLKDGKQYGLNLSYAVQDSPRGLPDAFIVGKNFIGGDDVALILGDNVFITSESIEATPNTIFTYKVKHPDAYGVVKLTDKGYIDNLVEKPKEFISNDAVVGLYVFDNNVVHVAPSLTTSPRGELEIVDLIKTMDNINRVKVQQLDGFWFDCGTHDDLLSCANLVQAIEQRTNKIVGLYE